MIKLPKEFKTRLRHLADGSYLLVRRNRGIEIWLDKHAIRIKNELRWHEIPADGKNLNDLKPLFKDKICYIIGKGPSLDYLTGNNFKNPLGPVLAINHAIRKIERLNLNNPYYMIQQDSSLRQECSPIFGDMLLSLNASRYYTKSKNKYIYIAEKFVKTASDLTAVIAISIAKYLGSTGAILMCFDACCNGLLGYAQCTKANVKSGGPPNRFLKHREIIERKSDLPLEWFIPERI